VLPDRGIVCPAVPHGDRSCAGGIKCSVTCTEPGTWGDCDRNSADPTPISAAYLNGCETDLRVDSQNCGSCGAACSDGEVCVNGGCLPDGTGGSAGAAGSGS
jgi:hypothetical protein